MSRSPYVQSAPQCGRQQTFDIGETGQVILMAGFDDRQGFFTAVGARQFHPGRLAVRNILVGQKIMPQPIDQRGWAIPDLISDEVQPWIDSLMF